MYKGFLEGTEMTNRRMGKVQLITLYMACNLYDMLTDKPLDIVFKYSAEICTVISLTSL